MSRYNRQRMRQTISAAEARERAAASEAGWALVLAAAREAERASALSQPARFELGGDGQLRRLSAGERGGALSWRPGAGWEATLPADDAHRAFLDLYLPICTATAANPITIGQLGQSLDGFIATHAGESQWVTGEQNIRHLHRLRALCDAVIVGAGTVAADDPQLTTRLVSGPNPLRVVLDPARRLTAHHRVFTDNDAETLYVCARSSIRAGERCFGRAAILTVEERAGGIDAAALLTVLRERGCSRIFVEGGGVTVSMFLAANLLDRLHLAIAPLLIGNGRPAIRFPPRVALGDCPRPRYRVFRMGGEVLFDCEFTGREDGATPGDETVTRVI
jgi:riboflavin-specific deaminase-like protein